MVASITASMLYDLVACPHRVTMDVFGDPVERDDSNPFVQLLWERGALHEREVIEGLSVPYLDLSPFAGDEKERLTTEAIARGELLIYGGRIQIDDLLGDPDLLRKEGDGYVAGDIKSGAGEEGGEDLTKPKKHYAVQLGLYTDILERKGIGAGRRGFIWDIEGKEVIYDFTLAYGARSPRTLWDDYLTYLSQAQAIVGETSKTLPAYGGICKLCHWYNACLTRLSKADDLTLIPELGRAKRDTMKDQVGSIAEFAACDPEALIAGKKTRFAGIGPDTLRKFHARARLLSEDGSRPYLKQPVSLPAADRELFFDIEVDPMRDLCYLHGFVERKNGDNETERFVGVFAEEATEEAERQAFAEAWDYIQKNQPCAIYYYSKYERTIYPKLQQKYHEVCTAEELEGLFNPERTIDLYYDVVLKATEWPTHDFSIKTLARYLGFRWRDTNPSGAASIEWFHRWIETGDPEIRQRILDYNEDDCRATRVLLDGIRRLSE